jgi:xanthine/CO dehydrogenase XdhC/CoxF family maturation factor
VRLVGPGEFPIHPTSSDLAVIMTHSLEQDTHILRELLARDTAYIGVLGPRRRTREMLFTLAAELRLPEHKIEDRVEGWLARLHAPMGLDLGGNTPAEIALAVIAEIQQVLHQASGRSLRQVRAGSQSERSVTVA